MATELNTTGSAPRATLKFQIASDLHLEMPYTLQKMQPKICPVEGCDILCLLGDIGTLKKPKPLHDLLDYVCEKWKHVLFVFGNHEFYHFRPTTPNTC